MKINLSFFTMNKFSNVFCCVNIGPVIFRDRGKVAELAELKRNLENSKKKKMSVAHGF